MKLFGLMRRDEQTGDLPKSFRHAFHLATLKQLVFPSRKLDYRGGARPIA